MNNKSEYLILKENLKEISKNINSINSNISSFETNCSNALLLNGETSYKRCLVSLKGDSDYYKNLIDNKVLVEIEQKM